MADATLWLTPPREDLIPAMRDYVEEFHRAGEAFLQQHRQQIAEDPASWLRRLHHLAAGLDLPPGIVPQSEYWLVADGRIVATARLRHRLTDSLTVEGGHVGYEVRPSERRKGYASRLLAMMLDVGRQFGLGRVLVTCDADNLASARVIRKNGGRYDGDGISTRTGKTVQRYWIELERP